MQRAVRSLAVSLALVVTACRGGDPVTAPIEGCVRAVEKRSAEDVPRFLAADYHDQEGWGPRDVESVVKRYVAGYDSLSISISKLDVEKGEGFARATFRAEMLGSPKTVGGLAAFLPRSSTFDFLVTLTEEKDSWKISSASWTAVR